MNSGRKGVVLLSGGLDSATVLAMASEEGFQITALSFRYGQRHSIELEKASRTAAIWNVHEHLIINLDPEPFRNSSLTSAEQIPPGYRGKRKENDIPSTYVPARNTVFLSFALGIAESRKADHIFIGVNSLDYSGYPDCRPEYILAFQNLADLATKRSVQGNPPVIRAPLLELTKAEIIRTGLRMGVDYSHTISCYSPDSSGRSCGVCDSCLIRLAGFRANSVADPAAYV